MNKKALIGLGIVAAVLAVLVVVQNQSRQPASILDQVRLVPLVPLGLEADAVGRLVLYTGALPDERVVLARSAQNPDQWVVATHHNAPVDEQRVREFIANALGLRGEFRTTARSDIDLATFDLTDEAGFHVIGYGRTDDDPLFHVLVGKSPSFRTVFMRQYDNQTVYIEELDLRRDAGVFVPMDALDSSGPGAPPANHWIRKEVFELASHAIERIEVSTPSRSFTLEKRTLPAPEPEEASDDEAADAFDRPEPGHEWVVADGGPGGPVKPVGVESLLHRFDSFRGETVVDPEQADAFGLEPPMYRLTAAVEGGEAPVVIEGGRPDPTGPGYVRLAGTPHIFQVQSFAFEGLFPRAAQLFDLPAMDLPLATISEIQGEGPKGSMHLVKGADEDWAVLHPSAPLAVQQTTVDDIARTAAVWKPVDYVDDGVETGLHEAPYTLTATRSDGAQVALRIGARSPEGGYFAAFDGSPIALRISETDKDRLFPPPSDLYQLALLGLDEDAAQRVAIERAGDAFTLSRGADGAWTLAVNGSESPADGDAVLDWLGNAGALQAREIAFDLAMAPGEPDAVVRIAQGAGAEVVVRFGPEEDARRWVTVDGMAGVYFVSAADADAILVEEGVLRTEAEEEAPAEA